MLAAATALPMAVIALTVLDGPAGVGSSLPFAHLRHAGAASSDVVNTRAIISFAWVAGTPLATAIMGWFGNWASLAAIAAVTVLNIATTAAMLTQRARTDIDAAAADDPPAGDRPMSRTAVGVIVAAFILLQATNAAVMSAMTLYVTESLGLQVMWAGVTLGVAAGLEIPALLLIGRLSDRISGLTLIVSGCLAGIAYYAAMAFVSGPVLLLALQLLNAWFFAAIAGVGLTLFQEIIPKPGLASGLYTNTRRLGGIIPGPIIGLGAMTALGYRGVFVACAVLTIAALLAIGAVERKVDAANIEPATPRL
jgi:SET family sugar efflux transporter-like MFS transporter